ncbi:MAG: hypothetical protein KAX38_09280, partial [Candidatus Krumholzibacteria bacterium]|nr:hypothetical protein [Candidatus Krumholzibacteria bacterium]
MRRSALYAIACCILCGFVLLFGCSGESYFGNPENNISPEVTLSSGPVEKDMTGYQVHFYWSGWDPDGEIA